MFLGGVGLKREEKNVNRKEKNNGNGFPPENMEKGEITNNSNNRNKTKIINNAKNSL